MPSTFSRSALAFAALLATAQTPAPAASWCTGIPLPDPRTATCKPLEIHAPRVVLRLAVATTALEREHGLMDVRDVPSGEGMLFAFADGDLTREFWMKDTLVPLDMIFVRADGRVSSVAADVPATTPQTPDERIPRRRGVGSYVIELAAGGAARTGIRSGTRLAIPRVTAQ
jgi:uncharacterized membrane protein (UPF0127 family)